MRKHLFTTCSALLIFLAIYNNTLLAQAYIPIPESNARWMIYFEDTMGQGVHFYYYNGDTIIDSNTYKIVYEDCEGFYAGGLRQDTSSRQVYFIPPDSAIEYLLFDYSLNLGDTLKSYSFAQCGYSTGGVITSKSIESIDSILIDSNYRRLILGNYFSLIEGIGSAAGLFEGVIENYGGFYWELLCFEHNGKVLFPNLFDTTFNDCWDWYYWIPYSIKERSQIIQDVIIQYNIIKNEIIFDLQAFNIKLCKLEIYNLLGKPIQAFNLIEPEKFNLASDNYIPGLYLYKISSKGGTLIAGKIAIY